MGKIFDDKVEEIAERSFLNIVRDVKLPPESWVRTAIMNEIRLAAHKGVLAKWDEYDEIHNTCQCDEDDNCDLEDDERQKVNEDIARLEKGTDWTPPEL